MRKTPLIAGLLISVLALQASSDSADGSPLLEALAGQQDSAEEEGSVIIDFGEVYAGYEEYMIVCQEAFRETALKHAGLADDAVEPLGDTESAVVAYSPEHNSNVLTESSIKAMSHYAKVCRILPFQLPRISSYFLTQKNSALKLVLHGCAQEKMNRSTKISQHPRRIFNLFKNCMP